MEGGHYFWLGASADADPAGQATPEAPKGSSPSGDHPLRECLHSYSLVRSEQIGVFWECKACGATFA